MSWLDLFVLAVIAYFVYRGRKSGAIIGLLELAGILLAFLVPYILYYPFSALLWVMGVSRTNAPIYAFLIILVVTSILYFWKINVYYRNLSDSVKDTDANYKLGAVTGFVKGLVVAALLATLFMVVPNRLVGESTARHSLIAGALSKPVVTLANSASPIFGPAIQKARGALIVDTQGHDSLDLGFTIENPRTDKDAALKMLEMVNAERTKIDLQPLVLDDAMSAVAEDYSKTMLKGGYFSHIGMDGSTPADRMIEKHIRFGKTGENIAYATTVEIAHDGLMRSPPHRKNILDPEYRRVGIGVAVGNSYQMMFTQEFAD